MAEKDEKPKPTAVDKGKGKATESEEKDKDGKPVKDESKPELPAGMWKLHTRLRCWDSRLTKCGV